MRNPVESITLDMIWLFPKYKLEMFSVLYLLQLYSFPCAIGGSGSTYIYGYVDAYYKESH